MYHLMNLSRLSRELQRRSYEATLKVEKTQAQKGRVTSHNIAGIRGLKTALPYPVACPIPLREPSLFRGRRDDLVKLAEDGQVNFERV